MNISLALKPHMSSLADASLCRQQLGIMSYKERFVGDKPCRPYADKGSGEPGEFPPLSCSELGALMVPGKLKGTEIDDQSC